MKPPKNYAYQFKGYELSDNPKDREWERHHRNRWPIAAGALSKYPSANPLDALLNSRGTILNIDEIARAIDRDARDARAEVGAKEGGE